MANRNFNRMQALDKEIKHIYAEWTDVSTPGNSVLNASRSAGVASITYNSVGNYTIVLEDTYPALFSFSAVLEDGSGLLGFATAGFVQLWSDDVADPDSKSLTIQFVKLTDGAAGAIPTDTTKVKFHAVLKNSNASAVGSGNLT